MHTGWVFTRTVRDNAHARGKANDIVLALVTDYFLRSAAEPVPPISPHLLDHQRWQGVVCWEWLCERRGWT